MTSICISSGHGLHIRGAADILDEVDEARLVVERVAELLRAGGVDVVTFHDDTSYDQSTNLATIVNFHNEQERDLDCSIHFNAFEHTDAPMGCECLYTTQEDLAAKVSEAIADAADFIDRGPKYRSDLYFLNNTDMPAILIETCFVDSETDADKYRKDFDLICKAIAETIGDLDISELPELPEPPEPEPLPPEEFTGENRVDIIGSVQGDVAVIINGQLIRGTNKRGTNIVNLDIKLAGNVTLVINGEEFHSEGLSIPPNQTGITASVFGGEDDYNTSAYDENVVLNDTDLYVALPDRFEGERPMVRVYNRVNGIAVAASIEDVGPWNTDDPYWETGMRPQAESGTDMSGRTTNGAGIDLSPALANALDIDGMGKVDWEFVD